MGGQFRRHLRGGDTQAGIDSHRRGRPGALPRRREQRRHRPRHGRSQDTEAHQAPRDTRGQQGRRQCAALLCGRVLQAGLGRPLLCERHIGRRHGRPARCRGGQAVRGQRRTARGRHTPLCRGGPTQCRQEQHHQRLHRRRPQHSDRDCRNHARQHIHAVRQVWLRLLPGRHRRHTPQEQGDGRPRVLLRHALHTRHREQRRMHTHD